MVNSHDENLGGVEDVLLSPKSGQIDYLVIGRDNAKSDDYWKAQVSR